LTFNISPEFLKLAKQIGETAKRLEPFAKAAEAANVIVGPEELERFSKAAEAANFVAVPMKQARKKAPKRKPE